MAYLTLQHQLTFSYATYPCSPWWNYVCMLVFLQLLNWEQRSLREAVLPTSRWSTCQGEVSGSGGKGIWVQTTKQL